MKTSFALAALLGLHLRTELRLASVETELGAAAERRRMQDQMGSQSWQPGAPAPPPAAPTSCNRALESACGQQRGSSFDCMTCAGHSQQQLRTAGCDNTDIQSFCSEQPGAAPSYVRQVERRVVRRRWGEAEGHRRAQAGDCNLNAVAVRLDAINAACCDEGQCLHGCSAACSAKLLPFWDECGSVLGEALQQFEPDVVQCKAAQAAPAARSAPVVRSTAAPTLPNIADQLGVECSDGTPAAECVPSCDEGLHGALLFLSTEGTDAKMTCQLRNYTCVILLPNVSLDVQISDIMTHLP